MKNITLLVSLLFTQISFSQLTLSSFEPTTQHYYFSSISDVYQNETILSARNAPIPTDGNQIFIFEKITGGMQQVARLTASDAVANDNYGVSVSIFGDYAAVGAPYQDFNGLTDSGAVYLYHKNNGVWEFQQKITAPAATQNEKFGMTIKMNQDHIFIGAPIHSTGTNANAGAIYVYNLEPTVSFSQMITDQNYISIGYIMDVDDNDLVFYSHELNQGYEVVTYTYSETSSSYEFANIMTVPVSSNQKIRLNENNLYVGKGFDSPENTGKVLPFHKQGNNWIADTPITAISGDNIMTSFDVSGDDMLIGMASYILLMPRKSPLLHYRKIAGIWTYQETLYGNGADGLDDAFGQCVSMSSELFIVSAPTQSQPSYGKAYYIDGSLGLSQFRKDFAVWPNPTSGELFISSDVANISKVEVYSVTGVLLIEKASPSAMIDLGTLSQGVYFVKLFTDEKTSTIRKVIKR